MSFLPFAATVGGWVAPVTATTTAAASATAGGMAIASTAAAAAAAATLLSSQNKQTQQQIPSVSPVTTSTPTTTMDKDTIAKQEKDIIRKGRTSRSTLMTGPSGLLEPATISKKVLLGE